MAKKTKKAEPSLMDQLAAYSPPWEEPVEKDEDKPDPTATLMERLAKLESRLEAQQHAQVFNSFQSRPEVTQAPAQKQVPQGINLENMPDPVTSTNDFTMELAKRISAMNDAKLAAIQAESSVEREREQLANNLWEGFKRNQPDWAEHEMLVEAAAGRVSQSLQQRGVNVVALMKANPDAFYGEIAGMLEKQYPQLKKTGSEESGEEEGGASEAIVFGGTPGKQKAGQEPMSQEDTNTAWLREVTAMQYKQGLK